MIFHCGQFSSLFSTEGAMFMVTHEGKFHALFLYVHHLITLVVERIKYFVKDLNSGLQVAALSVGIFERLFTNLVDFVKKEKGTNKQREVKAYKIMDKTGYFYGTYLMGHGS